MTHCTTNPKRPSCLPLQSHVEAHVEVDTEINALCLGFCLQLLRLSSFTGVEVFVCLCCVVLCCAVL